MRVVVLSSLVVLLAACGGKGVDVSWTIDGAEAADACVDGDMVRVTTRSVDDGQNGATTSVVTVPCSAGSTNVDLATSTTIVVDLLRSDTVVASSSPVNATSTANVQSGVAVDLAFVVGQANITFTVGNQSCADAGATTMEVTTRRRLLSADFEEIDTATVACADGYTTPVVDIGTELRISATTTIGDATYATRSFGQALEISRAVNAKNVNLDIVQ